MNYDLLFSQGRIGQVSIKNRVVMPPMEVGLANFDGTPSPELLDYYEERAKGGVGLVIPGITRVNDLHGAALPRQLSMSHDRHIAPMRELVNRVQRHGAKIFIQLHHPGRQNLALMIGWSMLDLAGRLWPGFFKKLPDLIPLAQNFYEHKWAPAVVAPSAVDCKFTRQKTRALTKPEIKWLVNDFIKAAVRVKLTGADGVELHAAHGYLLQQFLSTRTNKRRDEYGGSLENRLRFLTEIIVGVRRECGPDFPIMVRLSVDEFYRCIGEADKGIELEEGVEIARRLAALGVDAIDVTSATYETMNYWLEPVSFEPGWRKHLAAAVKQAVDIPVVAANLIRSAEQAEAQLKEGIQDFVALGRPHLADPHWCNKVREGREAEIKRCVNCLWCFESLNLNAPKGLPLECAVNPRLGREGQPCRRNGKGRTVVVVGAGPAGLTAAEILAERGFRPIVLDKGAAPGGQLRLAVCPPHKENLAWCYADLETAVRLKGVEIRCKTEVTPALIAELAPWAVIVATGAIFTKLPVDGISQAHVHNLDEILNGSVKLTGKRVAVIGSGLSGLETAEKLAEDGNQLIVVEMLEQIGAGAYHQHLEDVLGRLEQFKPEFISGHRLVNILPDQIIMAQVKTGAKLKRPVDAVVLAAGMRSNDSLYWDLKRINQPRLYLVGDASEVGRVSGATRSAFETAWNLD